MGDEKDIIAKRPGVNLFYLYGNQVIPVTDILLKPPEGAIGPLTLDELIAYLGPQDMAK